MEPFTVSEVDTARGHGLPTLDASVVARLRTVGLRVRSYVFVEGISKVVGFLLVAALVQLFVDYSTRGLRWSMRAALLAVIVVGALWVIWRRIVVPLRLRFGPAEVANLVERRYPQLSSLLISAVRFSSGEVGPSPTNSPALAASVIDRAASRVASLDFNVVLDPRRARWSALVLITALSACAAMTVTARDLVGLWFARNVLLQNVDWPKRTHLVVELEGEELIGARGDDLVVQARAQGVQPRVVDIVFETVSGLRGRETMVMVGSEGDQRYRHTYRNAQEDFDFYLEGGDDRTRSFHARLLERPRVTRTEMRIIPPAYARLDAMTLGDGQRAARILPGSEVTIRIEVNKPVTKATLIAGREVVSEATRDGDNYRVTISPDETHTYHFALVDEVGLDNRRPVRFSLRVARDEPPRVRMQVSGVGDMITAEAVLPIEVESADTYGLATTDLVYRLSREGAEDRLIPLPTFKPSVTTFKTTVAWPVATEALTAGESLTLLARAADFDDVSGPNTAESPEATLRVVTREELLAELVRREQEYRADFERLIDSQEQLRSASLTVLRRFQSPGGFETLAADLAPLERRQRTIAGSVNVIRQQFEQILAELGVNQLDTVDEQERLGDRIIEPLTRLAKRELVTSADLIRQWSREASTDIASAADRQQVAVLAQMRSVLANMIQWEGYQEVVNMLRDIIRLQQSLRSETRETFEDQADDVFDD